MVNGVFSLKWIFCMLGVFTSCFVYGADYLVYIRFKWETKSFNEQPFRFYSL